MLKKTLIRSLIICAWLIIIGLCLYFPKIKWFGYEDRTINVFTWGDILHPEVVKEFEMETGIKINLSYYGSNEELLVKMKATKGAGYDLIIPSDYAVSALSQTQLLKKIDKNKLSFWNQIDPNLLGHFFDPYNHYSIPFEWEVYGIGIDQRYFANKPYPKSWKLLFDPTYLDYRISMTNDPIEAVLFSSFYLFGPETSLSPSQIEKVKQLLIEQKPFVEVYAKFTGDYYLATGSCQAALTSSPYAWKTKKLFPHVGFFIPEEGSFITIENFVLPKASNKEELTYQLINFIFQKKSIQKHFESFGFFPSTLRSLENISLTPEMRSLVFASEEEFKKLHFMQEIISKHQTNEIWIDLKSGKF